MEEKRENIEKELLEEELDLEELDKMNEDKLDYVFLRWNSHQKKNRVEALMTLHYFLAYVVDQIDERTFQARISWTDKIVKCYLSHELFGKNTRPLVGDLIRLEYNSGLRRIKKRVYYIIEVIEERFWYATRKQKKRWF